MCTANKRNFRMSCWSSFKHETKKGERKTIQKEQQQAKIFLACVYLLITQTHLDELIILKKFLIV